MLEVKTSGRYVHVIWSRDGISLGTPNAPANVSEFTHFMEIFVREPTATSDLGNYEIVYSGAGGLGTTIRVIAEGIYANRTKNSSLI